MTKVADAKCPRCSKPFCSYHQNDDLVVACSQCGTRSRQTGGKADMLGATREMLEAFGIEDLKSKAAADELNKEKKSESKD